MVSDTITYTADHTINPVVAEAHTETIEEKIIRIATSHGISTTTLYNLVWSESRLDPLAVGDEGCSYGLVQINTCVWDISEEEAEDPDFALNWASEKLSEGKEYLWTVCSCVKTARAMGADLPKGNAWELEPNSNYPRVGGVVIFDYGHVAYIESQVGENGDFTVIEGNRTPCLIETRVVNIDDPHIKGYYKAPES